MHVVSTKRQITTAAHINYEIKWKRGYGNHIDFYSEPKESLNHVQKPGCSLRIIIANIAIISKLQSITTKITQRLTPILIK